MLNNSNKISLEWQSCVKLVPVSPLEKLRTWHFYKQFCPHAHHRCLLLGRAKEIFTVQHHFLNSPSLCVYAQVFPCCERKQQRRDETFALFANHSVPQNVGERLDTHFKGCCAAGSKSSIISLSEYKALCYLNMITKMLRHPLHFTLKRLRQ